MQLFPSIKSVNPEMLVLAREARGITQLELATKLGVSQSKVSKLEDGLIDLGDDTAEKLSQVLGFPTQFFFLSGQREGPSPTFYRKHLSLSASILKVCIAQISIVKRSLAKLLAAVEPIDIKVPYLDPDEIAGGPAAIARRMREFWRVPSGPIKNVTHIVEEAGILVVPFDFGTRKIDGCGDFVEGVPVVFMNKNACPARWRFTLLHEVAHLVMHRVAADHSIEEDQANTFASEFLMPEREIKSSLLPINIDRLARLKLHWRVSMQAILKRAGDLRLIPERTERYYFMLMGKMGMREVEPHENDIPRESPKLVQDLLTTHYDELGVSPKELAENLAISEEDLTSWLTMSPALRVVS